MVDSDGVATSDHWKSAGSNRIGGSFRLQRSQIIKARHSAEAATVSGAGLIDALAKLTSNAIDRTARACWEVAVCVGFDIYLPGQRVKMGSHFGRNANRLFARPYEGHQSCSFIPAQSVQDMIGVETGTKFPF